MEGILSSKLAGAGDGENPLGEAFSAHGLITETELPPLNGRAQPQFCRIVRGLNAFVGEEGKEMGPIPEGPFGSSAHRGVRAFPVFEAIALHSGPRKDRGILKLPTTDVAVAEGVPADK